MIVTFLLEVPN